MPPGLTPGGPAGADGDPVTRRIQAYSATGDIGVLCQAEAEQEAAALLDTGVRAAIRESSVDVQPRLRLLHLTGLLFWNRALSGPENDPLHDRDLALALALLAPLRDAAPESVPRAVSESIAPPTVPGTPQVAAWVDFAGLLLERAGPYDRTALLAAAAVLQLGIVMAETRQDLLRSLSNTVHTLLLMHERRSDSEALAAAVALARRLVAESARGTPEHAHHLARLRDALRHAYELGREPGVLAEAVELTREGLAALPPGHPHRPDEVTSLAGLLRLRHDDFGDSESLREAVALNRALVDELPPDHPARARRLNNLAVDLEALSGLDEQNPENPENPENRENRENPESGGSGDATALDEIIDLGRAALTASTAPGVDPGLRTTVHANLSRWLRQRARHPRSGRDPDADLAEALRLARQAHTGVADRPAGAALEALAQSLSEQYARTRDPAVLAEAVGLLRDGAAAAGDPARAVSCRFLLGVTLNNRFVDQGDTADAREAAALFREVARAETGTVHRRLESAWYAGKLEILLEDWANAAEDLALAVRLLPELAGWQLQAGDRERRLPAYAPLPTLAAFCALSAGAPARALELLEQGRGVLHGEVAAVRVDLDRLRARAPHLATGLEELPERLRSAPDADRRHRLADERRRLIEEIKRVPGFADFLSPPRIEEILAACRAGPVAVPMFGRYGSDALLVTRDRVRRLPLPRLTFDAVRRLGRDVFGGTELALDPTVSPDRRSLGEYSLRTGLAGLWDAVVGPVLEALGDDLHPTGAGLPRLWWCPTGPLTLFPLHMAERREEGSAFDQVISSYTPTVHALGRTRPWRPGPDSRPLVVALPRTPGAADLPAADEEAAEVAGSFSGTRVLRGPAATRARLTTALPDHDIVHVACHAGYDTHRHYEGHLVLHDGRLHFTDIATARTGRAGLAFLSACGTARNRLDLPDESLNLLTAFQLAGFSHLVGSLWPVADQANTHLVRAFYEHLTSQEDDVTVAGSLHHAVARLRDREPDRPSLWASHLHIGP
ncbi:CHAT domain-containing protein [Streptomyces sp. NPDC002588]|uniref:CHAT domain-containing protein n=1 Tax=Streptomyces sp. NPDC002588 TaxID=3154419 RepID=UPI0033240FFD